MNIKWNQSGMPATLVSRLGRSEFSEFKSVLSDAQNQVMTPVDAESMARELVQAGGREYVEMVRELTTALAHAKRDLESANRRYERLTADLARRGIAIDEARPEAPGAGRLTEESAMGVSDRHAETVAAAGDEWEEWDRKFQALLG